jgi:integrase
VGWTPEGRPIRRARYASSEREAKALLAEMVAATATARPLPDDRLTVGKWLVTWLRRLGDRDDIRPNTIAAYDRSVRLLLPELGNVPLRRLRSLQVTTALNTLRGRYTAHTVAGARSVLSTAIRDAMREGHVATNEAALARSPKVPRRGLPAPDTATVRSILAALEGHRLRALYVLLAGTGLRLGEATGLRWDEDVRADSLTVHLQLQRIAGENVLTDPKTDTAGRIVFLPPTVAEALRAHKAAQAKERIAAGKKWRRTGLVFTNREGEPVAASTAEWILAEACKRAGVRHCSPHDLRRFAATTIADAIGRDAAQRVMGHTDARTTDLYLTRTDDVLSRAAGALEEAIG